MYEIVVEYPRLTGIVRSGYINMYHRKPEKYKEFEGMENVVYGKGELIKVKTEQGVGYRAPCGSIIYDYDEALAYAKRLDRYIRTQTVLFTQQKLRGKPA